VLIMGYGSTMDMWDPRFLDNLSANYKVVIFDNRGMGNTTAPPGNFSIAQFADDTAGLMAAFGNREGPCAGLVHGVIRGSRAGIKEETVMDWLREAANHMEEIEGLLLANHALTRIQLDAMRNRY